MTNHSEISEPTANRWAKTWVLIGLAAFVGLCIYVLTRTKPPFYDEVPYFAQAWSFKTSDSFREWLLANDTGPTGPVHALMHYWLSGGVGVLPVPWCRLPNLLLLAVVLILIKMHLRKLNVAHPWAVATMGMAMPMTWVMAGMALTELPAMAGMAVASYATVRLAYCDVYNTQGRWYLTALIAIGIVISICGRQTYIVILPGLLLIASAGERRNFTHATLGIAVGLVPVVWLFSTWGGMVPPKMGYVGGALKPLHGLLAVCYAGICAFLLTPRFFRSHWRCTVPVTIVVATMNLFTQTVHLTIMASAQRFVGNKMLLIVLERSAGWIFVATGIAFVASISEECRMNRNRLFSGYAFAVLALCGACAGIVHQFSSRYVGMSLPFIIPLLAPWVTFSPWMIVRMIIAMGLGFASLLSYYAFA